MKVVNGDRAGIPGTERVVMDWLRAWSGDYFIGGVALSGCFVPDGKGKEFEADLVLITPQICAVVEVKGITQPVGGALSCPSNGPWSLPGIVGSPVHVRSGDSNPFDQVRPNTFNLKNLAVRVGIDKPFVLGLVLVLPQAGHDITLVKKGSPTGIEVKVGSLSGFRGWFHANARGRKALWSAEQAHALIRELNFAHVVTTADLAAEGFASADPLTTTPRAAQSPPPVDASRRARPRRYTDRPPAPALSAPPAAGTSTARNVSARTVGRPASPPAFSGTTRRSRPRTGPAVVATVLMVMLFGGGWWVFGQGNGGTDPRETTITGEVSQTITAPALPPIEEQPPAPPPSPTRNCYPFKC